MSLIPIYSNLLKTKKLLINYLSVRWGRKPFWLGLAKSKVTKVPQPKKIRPPVEKRVDFLLQQQYRVHMRSLYHFIHQENPLMHMDEEELSLMNPKLENKIALSLKSNEKWNEESKKLGEKYMEKMLVMESEKAKVEIEKQTEDSQKLQELLNEIVRKEKALSETYITPENLDEAIEESLKNVVEYDFAIDIRGNIYPGRETLEKKSNIQENKFIFSETDDKNNVMTEAN